MERQNRRLRAEKEEKGKDIAGLQKEMDKLLRAKDRLETRLEGIDEELESARYEASRVPARIQ